MRDEQVHKPRGRHLIRRSRTTAALTVGAILACGAFAGIAFSDSSTGNAQFLMENRSDTSPSSSNSTAWATLPGSQVSVGIFALGTRLVNARFTAESSCVGSGGICRVRLIALRDNGIVFELSPIAGDEFAFDSADSTSTRSAVGEGHAMERSRRLPQGNYQVLVQYSISSPSASFELDDWHFAVESSA